jgi:hypothetical protein
MLFGLTYLRFAPGDAAISVRAGAKAGDLTMHACTYATEQGAMHADCGTLVVPENRTNPKSRLIALPVTRVKGIRAATVGAVVGAVLGFHAVSGLMALITAIIGAAVVSNLSLLVLDIWTERAARRGTAAPAVELPETEHLEPALV